MSTEKKKLKQRESFWLHVQKLLYIHKEVTANYIY